MKINLGGKNFFVDVVECKSTFSKFRGLMFKKKKNARALLFKFAKPTKMAIHSFFVFFPFVAVWLDDKNKIIEKAFIRPFRLHVKPKKSYFALVEIPINKRYHKNLIRFLSCQKLRRHKIYGHQQKIQNIVDKRKL
jgi:uncharacterized membrane protein (UPF0127 family)